MERFCINLNIHYTAPKWVWNTLHELYTQMPYWNSETKKFDKDSRIIEISVEPGGLQIYAEMPEQEWKAWISEFKQRATKLLGYEIGEPEDGCQFKFWDLPLMTKYSQEELAVIRQCRNKKYPFEILSAIQAEKLDLDVFEKHPIRMFLLNNAYIAETWIDGKKVWTILSYNQQRKLEPSIYDDDLEKLFKNRK